MLPEGVSLDEIDIPTNTGTAGLATTSTGSVATDRGDRMGQFRVETEALPGEFRFTYELDGELTITNVTAFRAIIAGPLGRNVEPDTVDIQVRPGSKVRDMYQTLADKIFSWIAEEADIPEEIVKAAAPTTLGDIQIPGSLTTDLRNTSESVKLRACGSVFIAEKCIGETPIDRGNRVTFPTIPVPSVPGLDIRRRLQEENAIPEVTFRARPKGLIRNNLRGVSTLEVTLPLPPSALLDPIELTDITKRVDIGTCNFSSDVPQSLREEIQSRESKVNDFRSRSLEEQTTGLLEEIQSQRQSIISQAESDPDIPDVCIPQIESRLDQVGFSGCKFNEDVPQSIRSSIKNFEGRVDGFLGQGVVARTESARQRIQRDGGEILDKARSNPDVPDNCLPKIEQRVQSKGQELRGLAIISEDQLPCSQRFSDVAQSLSTLEDDLSGSLLEGGVDPGRIERRRIDPVARDIASVDDDRCREQFTNRLENINSEISRQAGELDVIAQDQVERIQKRANQRVQEIRERTEETIN